MNSSAVLTRPPGLAELHTQVATSRLGVVFGAVADEDRAFERLDVADEMLNAGILFRITSVGRDRDQAKQQGEDHTDFHGKRIWTNNDSTNDILGSQEHGEYFSGSVAVVVAI